MNNRVISALVIAGGLMLSVFVMLNIMFNPTGGLAGLVKYSAIPLVAVCFLAPKTGLVLLCWINFYADYYKKLAVYYGTSSMMTVMEILALSMAMVGAILAGAFAHALLRGPAPERTSIMVSIVTAALTVMLFFAEGADGMSGRVQYAVNGGLYLGLAAVMCYMLPDREASLRLCRLQFWLGVPWVIWAVRQYVWGFTEMEWYYARKGFSPVLSGQMLGGGDTPRPYGFAGSSSAFGAVTYLFMFGIWHSVRMARKRMLYFLGAVLYAVALFVSMQRTILVLPVLTFGAYLLFRTPGGTKFFYISSVTVLLTGILMSDFLFARVGEADASIRSAGDGWSSKVVRVGTFSDRLKGWTRLKRAKSYSLFGTKYSGATAVVSFDHDDYSHDVINRILINYGVVGLLLTFGFLFWTAKTVHGIAFRIRDPMDRDIVVFVIAVVGVNGIGTLMTGNNTHTVPINLVLATLVGLAACAVRRNAEAPAEETVPAPGAPGAPRTTVLPGAAAPPGMLRPSRAQFRMRPGRR